MTIRNGVSRRQFVKTSLGVAGAALSGAGPSVLMVLRADADEDEVRARVRELAGADVELVSLWIAGRAVQSLGE